VKALKKTHLIKMKNEVENLKQQNIELQFQLDVEKWLNQMYKSVLTEGKFEVKNGLELYRSVFAIGKTQEAQNRKVIDYFDEYFEGEAEIYFTFTDKKWLVNIKQDGGEVMFWLPECL
jgi:hypothetical protein